MEAYGRYQHGSGRLCKFGPETEEGAEILGVESRLG